ncbi:MAG: hypothetical protein ACK47B_12635 [Armatimonadota bacterium]
MIPVRVTLEGFLSYRERQTLEFDGSSLWVLAGPNGAGKSAIFDAITFSLFDTHRLGRQRADELINHHCDSLEVEFDFLGEGTLYRVRRTVRRVGRGLRATREAFRLTATDEGKVSVDPIPGTDAEEGFSRWIARTIGLNYDAFTSSVLLLQGQSEELLKAAGKKKAYEILKQLIDLSPYEQLHVLTDARRKHWDGQKKGWTNTRDGIAPVSDEALEAAEKELRAAVEVWTKAQEAVERLTALAQQAKQWEQLSGDLQKLEGEIRVARDLLAREEEIVRNFARLEELERVLPMLGSILAERGRLDKQESESEELEQQLPGLESALQQAEAEHQQTTEKGERVASRITDLQAKRAEVSRRVADIAPLVTRLEHWETVLQGLKEVEEQLGQFPSDLAEQLEAARQRDRALEEAEKSFPWLRSLTEAREGLAGALGRLKAASDRLQEIEAALKGVKQAIGEQSTRVEQARAEVSKMDVVVGRAKERCDQARERLELFLDAATERVCSLCGQQIDETHVADERQRLETATAAAAAEVEDGEAALVEARGTLGTEQAALADLQQQADSLEKDRQKEERKRDRAEQDARQHRGQLTSAYGNLSPGYRARVAAAAPQDDATWLAASFSNENDLQTAAGEAGARTHHRLHLNGLEQQQRGRERLDDRRQHLEDQRQELEKSVNVEGMREARAEKPLLEERQQLLDDELGRASKEQEAAKKALEAATRAVDSARQQRDRHAQKLTTAIATREEIRRNVTGAVQKLEESWRDLALAADEAKLNEYQLEKKALAPAREEKRAVDSARDALAGLQKRATELEEKIGSLPREARRASTEVDAELNVARAGRDGADECRRHADGRYKELQDRKQRREAAEEKLRTAERQHYLHNRLTQLLGREGLQLSLLRRAERGIVDLANETLEGLSRGRLHLELRSDGASDSALDLVAYNLDTGPKPVAVALNSGSQKFRIAVSLALAIGRYAGLEARRIESVIIDEGFGSLDRNGRDDMIQELHELKQHLQRIILVSHQEEFTGAFANGYGIALENGGSRVSLLECG